MALEVTNRQEIQDRKRIRDSMMKFGSAMKELSEKTSSQTKILSSMLSMNVKDAFERRRKERLESVQKDKDEKSEKRESYFVKAREKVGGLTGTDGSMGSLLNFAFSKALRGASLVALAPLAAETASNFVQAALEQMGVSEKLSSDISAGVGKSAAWGALGLIFGRKIGLMLAGGSLLWEFVDKKLDLSPHIRKVSDAIIGEGKLSDSIVEGIGPILTTGLMFLVPGIAGRAVSGAFSLIRAGGGIALDAAASAADALAPGLRQGIMGVTRAGLRLAMRAIPGVAAAGIISLYAAYGDDASKWISDQTGIDQNWSDAAVSSTSFAAAGASLGMMFGPGGAIIGGVVGLVAGLGYSVWKWFARRKEEARKAAEEEMAETDRKIRGLDTGVNIETGLNENIRDYTEARSVARDETRYTAAKEGGKAFDPMEIVAPIQDSSRTSSSNIHHSAVALSESLKEVMENYDGNSEESRKKLAQSLHSLYAIKKEIDEERENNNGRLSQGLIMMDNLLKKDGNRFLRFAQANASDIISEQFYDETPKFRKGTKGFQDFGTESVALLHGKEAVVPEGTDAANFLKSFFNDDWSSKIGNIAGAGVKRTTQKITSVNRSSTPESNGNIIFSPTTISPTTTVVGGSSVNNSRITSIGGGGSSLDFGLPKGAF